MSRSSFYIFIVLLVVVGLVTAWMRHVDTGIPLKPGEKASAWMIEARVDFKAMDDKPVLASLNLPKHIPGFRLFFEQTASPGYGFSIVDREGVRRGEWSIREASGPQTLYYKVQVVVDKNEKGAEQPKPEAGVKRINLIWDQAEQIAAEQLLSKAYNQSSTDESLTRELIKLLSSRSEKQNSALLLEGHSKAQVLQKLLTDAGITARMPMGLYLEDRRRNQSLVSMIEIYTGGKWHLFDPKTGKQGLPENFLLWNRGGLSLIELMGGENAQVSFSMIEQKMPPVELAQEYSSDEGFGILSIHHLPIEEQSVFKLLLLLPIGALITVMMRVLVGIKTSGTFMPVLIAMAFIQTSLGLGLINFVAIVAIGLMLRSYLSALNLLLVSRIATIIVIVIFIIGLMSLVGYKLGFNTGMTVAFFPIIILAWTIERMSILWEEEGARQVLIRGGGSLIVAVMAYLGMQSPWVGYLSFNFPELNLVVVAMIMLLGRYTGYRLLELRRFQAMDQQ